MNFILDLQNKFKGFRIKFIFGILTIYFSFHAINGDRGLLQYLYLQQEISTAQKEMENYQEKKHLMEYKVKHLSNSSLDLDLLEERARIVLNLVSKDDFIILDDK